MTRESLNARPSLLVFSDDWGRHPSSCQHLMRHLLDRHRICWVNTIGMRRPRFDRATVLRGLEKFRHWSSKKVTAAAEIPNLRVLNPRMWPSFGSAIGRRLNRELLCRQLRVPLKSHGQPVVAVTTLPITADLIGNLPVDRWIYYCVDDFTQWPGLDQHALRCMERQLVRHVDLVIAVSETLRKRLAGWGIEAELLTHGIDLDHWQSPSLPLDLPQWESLERPLVVFWGVVDRRMDLEFLRQLGGDLRRGTIVLIGPESDPDPAIHSIRRVVQLPAISYDKLPSIARESAVLIMPYADLPVTRAMQPLKLKEYLATGKPAVVRRLPAVCEWTDSVDAVDTAHEFSQAVQTRIEAGLPDDQRLARDRLRAESWSEKAARFEQWILG